MPLFICSVCHSVDNTALTDFWQRTAKGVPPLCSGCSPETHRWHGDFDRRVATPEMLDAHGHNHFPVIVGGMKSLPLFVETK